MVDARKTVFRVAMVHAVALFVLFVFPFMARIFEKPPPPPEALFVSLLASAPVLEPPVEIPSPPAPAPVAPVPVPEKPVPPPPKPEKKKIEISKKRVQREPEKPKLTPEEIRRQLALKNQPVASASGAQRAPLPAWYYASVRDTMYRTWVQPAALSALSGYQVQVLLEVGRDGHILKYEVIRRSGNTDMDQSVLSALDKVKQLQALPPEYKKTTAPVTVTFELTQH